LAAASASVIRRLTGATTSSRSAIAPVNTATGLKHWLLIVVGQISVLPHAGARISASVVACASHTAPHAVWLAHWKRRALAVLADDGWLGPLRADPINADGALGPQDLPLPPARIERDPAPVS
jgi:hypothetical protein